MFAPNVSTYQLADQIDHDRLSHSALLQKVARERSTDSITVDREAQRRVTRREQVEDRKGQGGHGQQDRHRPGQASCEVDDHQM